MFSTAPDKFGYTPKMTQNRALDNEKIMSNLRTDVDTAIGEIRGKTEGKEDSWVKIVPTKYITNNVSQYDRFWFIGMLNDHPNIISRISNSFKTSQFRPYGYRWVSEEEKQALGIRAIAYKELSAEQIDWLENKLKDLDHELKCTVNHLGMVLNRLVSTNKDTWNVLTTMSLSTTTGMPYEEAYNAVEELHDMGILHYAKLFKNTKGRYRFKIIYALSFDDKLSAELEEQINNGEAVSQYQQKSGEIGRQIDMNDNGVEADMKNKTVNIILKNDDSVLDEYNVNNKIKAAVHKAQSSILNIALEASKAITEQTDITSKQKAQYESAYNAFIRDRERTTAIKEQNKSLGEEVERLNKKLEEMENKIEKLEKTNEAFEQFNVNYRQNAQDTMEIMLGRLTSLVERYASKPSHNELESAKFKNSIMRLAGDTMNKIVSGTDKVTVS